MAKLQAVRGMHDILMHDTPRWQFLEDTIKAILDQYSYQEIRLPIVEKTELFKRSIGDNTDIVSKEMYSFDDRNETSLTLRPEGTASCVRAGIEHGLPAKSARHAATDGCTADCRARSIGDEASDILRRNGRFRFARRPESESARAARRHQCRHSGFL